MFGAVHKGRLENFRNSTPLPELQSPLKKDVRNEAPARDTS